MAAAGIVQVEKVGGQSTVTRCFSKYPLKLLLPKKVGSSQADAVWIYALSYGGGIVSGDRISCSITVGDGCTAAMTTQASTKIYKSVGSKCSEQTLEVLLERNASTSIAERMQEYNVMAMIIIMGPKLKHLQNQMRDEVKRAMSVHLRPLTATSQRYTKSEQPLLQRPALIASCSPFGPQAIGMVVRVAATNTELVYMFLRHHLGTLEPFLGARPYCQSGR